MGRGSDVRRHLAVHDVGFWLMVSPPDAKWKAPYSARFHVGASAPGG